MGRTALEAAGERRLLLLAHRRHPGQGADPVAARPRHLRHDAGGAADIGEVLPLTHFLVVIRAIMLKGSAAALAPEILALSALVVAFALLAPNALPPHPGPIRH